MDLLGGPSFALPVPAYPGTQLVDLLTGALVAAVAALLGLAAVYAFPHAHRLFHSISNPVLMVTAGGMLLGVLGIVGGSVTLFKGLDEMKELTRDAAQYTATGLALVAVIKLAAMLIAGTCGFRGGRIFPSVFVGCRSDCAPAGWYLASHRPWQSHAPCSAYSSPSRGRAG